MSKLLMTLIFLAVTLSGFSAKAENFNRDAVHFNCIPELGFFDISQKQLLSELAESIDQFAAGKAKLFDKRQVVLDSGPHGKEATYAGKCDLSGTLVEWTYEDRVEPGNGYCGYGNWGGFLTLSINGKIRFDRVQFGGHGWGCYGGILQSLALSARSKDSVYLSITGFFNWQFGTEYKRLNWPISAEELKKVYPDCDPVNLQSKSSEYKWSNCLDQQTVNMIKIWPPNPEEIEGP